MNPIPLRKGGAFDQTCPHKIPKTQERFRLTSGSTKGFGRLRRRRLRPEPLVDPEPRGEREKGGAPVGAEERSKAGH